MPSLEERAVDVLGRVHAEAVHLELTDPLAEHLREPVHDERLLGEDVVEPEEVALLEAGGRAAREVDVSAVVVPRDVVQPGWPLEAPVLRKHESPAAAGSDSRGTETSCRRVALRRERLALAVAVRHLVGATEGRAAGGDDHVGRVIDDDVEVDLHPRRVGALDERGEVRVRAEMRVDAREVETPVPVVRRTVGLHVLLRDDGRHPDRGEAEILDPREAGARVRARPR